MRPELIDEDIEGEEEEVATPTEIMKQAKKPKKKKESTWDEF